MIWKKVKAKGYGISQKQMMGPPKAFILYKDGTSESYTTFVNGIIRIEGESVEGVPSKKEAEHSLKTAVEQFLKNKPGTVYWRIMPEVKKDHAQWRARCRLLITESKPDKELNTV